MNARKQKLFKNEKKIDLFDVFADIVVWFRLFRIETDFEQTNYIITGIFSFVVFLNLFLTCVFE